MFTFLGIVAFLGSVGLYVYQKLETKEGGSFSTILLGAAICFGLCVLDGIVIVGAGQRAVVFDKVRGVRPEALGEGIHVIMPFVQSTTKFDCRMQKAEFDATAASKDLQDVSTTVALNFHPQPDAVAEIYQSYGTDYTEKVIHPAVQEALKAVTAMYTAEELVTKREEVKHHVQDALAAMMLPAKLTLKETYITNFKFSEGFTHAIEAKQIAEQNALKAKRDLDRIKIEAEQKLASAMAEAAGLKAQREAITPQLIELRKIDAQKLAIEKWNGILPVTIMGGALPFVNIGHDSK